MKDQVIGEDVLTDGDEDRGAQCLEEHEQGRGRLDLVQRENDLGGDQRQVGAHS